MIRTILRTFVWIIEDIGIALTHPDTVFLVIIILAAIAIFVCVWGVPR